MIAHDDEPRWQTWRRRARTIPLLFCLALLALATLPVSAALAILVAPLERRRGATLRCVGFFTSYLFGEMLFLMLAFGQWVAARPWTPAGALRLARWTEWLCNAWFGLLHASGQLFFELRIEVTGLEALDGGGPLIMMLRHCSMGDTPLAPVYLGRHQGLRLRLVAKHELLGDPLLDVLGGRMRSCFVRRGSSNTAHEVEAVCTLLDALGPRDAVVIYPEGTRFSPGKQARALERLAGHVHPSLLARARRLRHMLPPRLGGPIALLERNPGADVLFCVHVGYEGAVSFRDLFQGRAIGQHIQVHFRRVPFAHIPTGRDALTRWLFEEWSELDDWIDEHLGSMQPRESQVPAPVSRPC